MKINDLLSLETIDLNVTSNSKEDILNKAIDLMFKSGVIKDKKTYADGIFAREKQSSTGVGEGIAIPHCKSNTVTNPHLVAMRIPNGVEFESLDGEPVKLLFMIAAPDSKDNVHLDVLATLSQLLMDPDFSNALINAKDKEEFLAIIDKAEKAKNEPVKQEPANTYPRLLAATSCPTGIAHTYMAKEALEKAAAKKNISIKVETNGSGGRKNGLTSQEIEHADAIIVAADAYVEMDRFAGKHLIEVGTSKAIKDPSSLIDKALDAKCPIYKAKGSKSTRSEQSFGEEKKSGFQKFYRHLMSGISHMIPFVVAGGIILALAYIIDACCGNGQNPNFGHVSIAAQIFYVLGAKIGLALMLPVLGGFIAYSIAGKPALVSGFVGSFAATFGTFNISYFILLGMEGPQTDPSSFQSLLASNSAGFLGAIIAGFAAGIIVSQMKDKWFAKVHRNLEGIRDMLIIPLLSTIMVGIIMLLVNSPLSMLNILITMGLTKLAEFKLIILLGALVSALMAIDMGGPINKAAHYTVLAIMTSSLQPGASAELQTIAKQLMAANIVGIMTPPVGIAIATWLFPQKFSKEDRKPSLPNIVTGCCGITEGAIPYVMKDPGRVIASTVTGAAIGGLIAVLWGAEAIAPEGGTISMLAMGAICYKGILSMIIGSFATAFMLGLLKKDVPNEQSLLGKWKGIPFGARSAGNKIHELQIRLGNHKPEFNQLLYEDHVNRVEAIKKDLDNRLADKKEHSKPEKYLEYEKLINKKKAKADAMLLETKKKLEEAATNRAKNFDSNKFAEYEQKNKAKQEKILEKEKKRLDKQAKKLAKKEK